MGRVLEPEYPYQPAPLHVCSIGRFSPVSYAVPLTGTPVTSTAAWPVNNLAIYVPISLPVPCVLARFMVANGSNITGNVDVGIYTVAGVLITSTGTTLRANASAVQYIDVTDRAILPGRYYLALVGSSTTGTYLQGGTFANTTRSRMTGLLEETLGGTTLPGTMTPVAYGRTNVYQFGFTQSATL